MSQSRRFLIVAVLAWACGALPAIAQLDPRVDGRALDANNQIGFGGYNAPQRSTYSNASNLIITGNVTGGRSFQGYSPIRDTSSLFMTLPTANLSNFRRDSIGFADVAAGRSQATVSPFYLPSSTVTSVGSLGAGISRITPGRQESTFVVPRVDLFTGKPLSVDGTLNPGRYAPSRVTLDKRFLPEEAIVPSPYGRDVGTFQSLPTPLPGGEIKYQNLRLIDSPIFGLRRGDETGSQDFTTPGLPGYPGYPPGTVVSDTTTAQRSERAYRSSLLDRWLDTDATDSPITLAPTVFGQPERRDPLTGRPISAPAEEGMASSTLPEAPSLGMAVPLTPSAESELEGKAVLGSIADAASPTAPLDMEEFAPTGQSVYQDFQLAVQWADRRSEQPETEVFAEGAAAEEAETPTWFNPSASQLQQLLDQAPSSFAGEVESDLNVRIRRGEAFMREGKFYDAAAQYAIAATLAPDDPLVRLGQGHAYLAAGDYLSAVYYLTLGLEHFSEVARFKLDLYNFVNNPNILDIRRADLENKLERREDYRLRFLLGYAEYYGGLKEFGLRQLELAAEEAPTGSVIARFPKMLKNTQPTAKEGVNVQSP